MLSIVVFSLLGKLRVFQVAQLDPHPRLQLVGSLQEELDVVDVLDGRARVLLCLKVLTFLVNGWLAPIEAFIFKHQLL